ncbi:hypothetical protein D3C76_929190 [compost metagenome]
MTGKLRMHDQRLDHGRHDQDVGDALAFDGLHHVKRVEGRDEDARQAQQRNQNHPRQRRQVEHRRDVQGQRIGWHRDIGGAGHGSGPQVHVRLHHAFRSAGGAAGVHDAGQVITTTEGIIDRLGITNELFVRQHALGGRTIANMDQQRSYFGSASNGFGHRQKGVVDHQDTGVAVVQRVGDFRHGPADVDRIEHATAPPGGEVVLEKSVAVQTEQTHAVAGVHASLLQGAGQASNAVGQLCVSLAPVTEDRRQSVGALLQDTV